MEANRDIALRAAECGVEVYVTRDGDLHLHIEYVAEENTAQVQASKGLVLLVDRTSDKILGVVATEYRTWFFVEQPLAADIYRQYGRARCEATKHDASVRLFLSAVATAVPALAEPILQQGEEWTRK